MESLTRHFQRAPYDGSPVEHFIYTRAEADEKGIRYHEDWRQGWAQDWVLTDDGFVMQIAYTNVFAGADRISIQFVAGKKIVRSTPEGDRGGNETLKLEWEAIRDFPGGANLSAHRVQGKYDILVRTTRVKMAIELYVNLWIFKGGRLTRQDKAAIGRQYKPKDLAPHLAYKWLFSLPQVHKAAMKRLSEALTDKGITFETVVDTVQLAKKIATSEGKSADILKAAEFELNLVRLALPEMLRGERVGEGENYDADIIEYALPEETDSQKQIRKEIKEGQNKNAKKK